ncbi:YceI family protein [Parapedobacter tibetensis]|uniref:YceI family protein n=1 Tax=Parapedobacter tibetensis TaxID=2972951 RepID=UPI00214D8004|nr:YceI family protein [Parapedobacter tibetensis]
MKNKRKVLSSLIIMLAGVIYFPVLAQQKNGAQDVVYQLDVKKSKLFWKAPKNQHNGFILFNSGTLSNFTADRPTRGTFSINMNSMRSTDEPTAAGRKKVDDELRSEGFFAVSRYPTATMLVKQILPEQNPATYRVSGELTIKGVTKTIEFTTIMKQNSSTITATANMSITRANWNINHQPEPTSWNIFGRLKDNLVDDEIPVSLELVFTKK